MKQEHYDKLVEKLTKALETKDLGERLECEVYRYICFLSDDDFSEKEKNGVASLAEILLGQIGDLPDKKNEKKRGSLR